MPSSRCCRIVRRARKLRTQLHMVTCKPYCSWSSGGNSRTTIICHTSSFRSTLLPKQFRWTPTGLRQATTFKMKPFLKWENVLLRTLEPTKLLQVTTTLGVGSWFSVPSSLMKTERSLGLMVLGVWTKPVRLSSESTDVEVPSRANVKLMKTSISFWETWKFSHGFCTIT